MTRFLLACVLFASAACASAAEPPVRVLFLGDNGHHRPAERFAQLQPVLAARGIELVYTDRIGDIMPQTLAAYDALAVYANIDNLPPEGEATILEFVRNGKGLVPLHCASFCFRNSPAWIDLVGAQFQKHGTGDRHEPWTWVRTEGKGRVFYTAWGQTPLAPEESRRHAITPAGLRVELFASEPLLEGKPLAMCFDGDGTMFVAESVDYPNDLVEPPKENPAGPVEGHDRIAKLTDTDGDGQADRRDVFAEKLSIPTSLLAHDGGLIVAMAPNIVYLKDTDGDRRADLRKVLFSGWGTGDTHAGPSNLTWGLDGWVYGIVGYSGFNGMVGGVDQRFGAGFWCCRPDGSKLEYLRSTNNNSWGFGFSEEGLLFGSTANGNPSEHMPLPNRVYERVRGWSATTLCGIAGSPEMELAPKAAAPGESVAIRQVDHHGHFTAAAGHRLYTARAYPCEYWNRTAFTCEPTGHIVATFELMPEGAAFRSRMAWDLLASDDEWTAPVQADVGPDGQVWVIDWYNFIVQHNPTPAGFETGRRGAYVTPLRDKTHGRIWRVVHDKAAPTERLEKKLVPLGDIQIAERAKLTVHPDRRIQRRAKKILASDGGLPTARR